MDLGIGLAPSTESWRTAKLAEELGLSRVWFFDSPLLYGDVFVAMAIAARETSRIKLSPGVLVPSNRIAPVTANALATVGKLAPGRVELGIGTGFTSRATMGLERPVKLADLRHHVEVVRALLDGATIAWNEAGAEHKVRFIEQDGAFIELDHAVPIHVSAMGPNAHLLAAEIGDGWATVGPTSMLLEQALLMDAACRSHPPSPAFLRSAHTQGCVLEDGERADSDRARAEAGPQVAAFLHGFVAGLFPVPAGLEDLVDAYREAVASRMPEAERHLYLHKGHYRYVREEEQPFITGELIKAFTFTGTRSELREQASALRDAGYGHLSIAITPGHEDAVQRWAELMGGLG